MKFKLWFGWIMIYLFGGMVWNFAFKLYNRMENLRPGGGFGNYTQRVHMLTHTPKYELTYEDCEYSISHNAMGKHWETEHSIYGEVRCPGCGIHRGGL